MDTKVADEPKTGWSAKYPFGRASTAICAQPMQQRARRIQLLAGGIERNRELVAAAEKAYHNAHRALAESQRRYDLEVAAQEFEFDARFWIATHPPVDGPWTHQPETPATEEVWLFDDGYLEGSVTIWRHSVAPDSWKVSAMLSRHPALPLHPGSAETWASDWRADSRWLRSEVAREYYVNLYRQRVEDEARRIHANRPYYVYSGIDLSAPSTPRDNVFDVVIESEPFFGWGSRYGQTYGAIVYRATKTTVYSPAAIHLTDEQASALPTEFQPQTHELPDKATSTEIAAFLEARCQERAASLTLDRKAELLSWWWQRVIVPRCSRITENQPSIESHAPVAATNPTNTKEVAA